MIEFLLFEYEGFELWLQAQRGFHILPYIRGVSWKMLDFLEWR